MESVIKKLKFKDAGVIINVPIAIESEFLKTGFSTAFNLNAKSKNTIVFLKSKTEFINFLTHGLKNAEYDSVLWFAYPKGSSKIKTDINRDILMVVGNEFGMDTVAAVSIDETWSGLRFRPIEKVGK